MSTSSSALAKCTETELKREGSISESQNLRNMTLDSNIVLSNGFRMPVIGIGTCLITDKEAVEVTLTSAIDAGYRLIDTAFGYMNQNLIGESLKKLFDSGKIKREDLFIVDKLPNNGMRPGDVKDFFEKSSKALQLEYIDLYLIHSPIATKRTSNDTELFSFKDDVVVTDDVDLSETWRAMESLVHNRRVRFLGLSNFNSKQIQRIYDGAEIKPANLQVECHVYLPQHPLLEFCKDNNISLAANCPLGTPNFPQSALDNMGLDYGNAPKLLEEEKVKQLAQQYHKTPAQVLLRYLVQRGIAPIPKSIDPKQIKEYSEIFDFFLEKKDVDLLESLENGFRFIKLDFWRGMKEHPEYPFNIPY